MTASLNELSQSQVVPGENGNFYAVPRNMDIVAQGDHVFAVGSVTGEFMLVAPHHFETLTQAQVEQAIGTAASAPAVQHAA
ncbi:MAG: hypothetical protein WBP26_00455 [Candidatus Saccharimonadales bacterium]